MVIDKIKYANPQATNISAAWNATVSIEEDRVVSHPIEFCFEIYFWNPIRIGSGISAGLVSIAVCP